MANPLISYWPRVCMVLVGNDAIPLTIAEWPQVKLVLIIAVSGSTRRRFAGTVI